MIKKQKSIFIGFGANLGNPQASFIQALQALSVRDVHICALSSLWQSPAWPTGSSQPDYMNGCACVDYAGDATALMSKLHAVETALGRVRKTRNAARVIDLDLLDFDGIRMSGNIMLPHPRLLSRAFVLLPLQEIAPDWRDPEAKLPIRIHIAQLAAKDIAMTQRLHIPGWPFQIP